MTVDGSFAPSPRAGVDAADLDGEVIVFDTDSGELHRLDPIGSVVWRCIDGESTVDDLVADLAAAFSVDPVTVRVDVISLTESLLEAGLLSRAEGDHTAAPTAAATPDPWPRVLTNPPSP